MLKHFRENLLWALISSSLFFSLLLLSSIILIHFMDVISYFIALELCWLMLMLMMMVMMMKRKKLYEEAWGEEVGINEWKVRQREGEKNRREKKSHHDSVSHHSIGTRSLIFALVRRFLHIGSHNILVVLFFFHLNLQTK